MKAVLTKASRPMPNIVGHFSAKLYGGVAHARRWAAILLKMIT